MDPARVPKRRLYTGAELPAVGLGTFGSDKYGAREIADAVYGAVSCGYRLIDCASVYQNEKEIGGALAQLFREKVVTREELFITGKVWNDMHGEGQVEEACAGVLRIWDWMRWICIWYTGVSQLPCPRCDGDARNPDSRPFFRRNI